MGISQTRYYRKAALDSATQPPLSVEHQRILACRHPVYHRNGLLPHSTAVCRIEYIAVHVMPVGIRTVENDKLDIIFGSRLHHPLHRYQFRIETATHFRHIENYRVHPFKMFARRFLNLSVKRYDRHTGLFIHRVGNSLTCIRSTGKTVFRSEYFHDIRATVDKQIERMALPCHGRRYAAIGNLLTFKDRLPRLGTFCRINDTVVLSVNKTRETKRQYHNYNLHLSVKKRRIYV